MAALRRGIMHYADGTVDAGVDWAAAQGMPQAPPAAQPPTGGGGFSQVLSGQPAVALQNSEASPATKAIAGFVQQAGMAKRAAELVNPPSVLEHVINLFGGNDATSAALQQRQQTANALADPLVQRFVATHPDYLTEAEQNKDAFAAKAQTPEFQKVMQDAINNHAAVSQGVPVTDGAGNQRTLALENPSAAAKAMNDHNVTSQQAAGLTHPHQMSREEFVNSMRGIPMRVAQMFINAQSAHVFNPQQQIQADYAEELRAQYAYELSQAKTDAQKAKARQNYLDRAGTIAGAYARFPSLGGAQ